MDEYCALALLQSVVLVWGACSVQWTSWAAGAETVCTVEEEVSLVSKPLRQSVFVRDLMLRGRTPFSPLSGVKNSFVFPVVPLCGTTQWSASKLGSPVPLRLAILLLSCLPDQRIREMSSKGRGKPGGAGSIIVLTPQPLVSPEGLGCQPCAEPCATVSEDCDGHPCAIWHHVKLEHGRFSLEGWSRRNNPFCSSKCQAFACLKTRFP